MASIFGSALGAAINTAINTAASMANSAVNKKQNTTSSSSSSSSSASKPTAGSASGIGVYDEYQQAIKDQMNANSQAWHNATTQAEKDRLHQENLQLSQQLGGNISYDGSTGKWSGNSSTSSSQSNSIVSGGSASGIGVYDEYQQAIIDQMNANSKAWYTATTQAEKDRLHQENIKLAAQLGGNISYNGSTGQWTGSAGMPEVPQYQPTDNSEYLNQMAQAYLEQQKEALKQAYEQNLSNLQAEQDKLGANYQAARNQEAADSALSQKRWNETAAAYGLNSGTQGQAALSYSNQLQSDLSNLQAAESAANAEIERQRTDLGKEYQSAMTQAIADNNYQLYQLLYQEAVRVDQALQNQSQYNASLALQKYQTMLDKYYNDQSFKYTQDQANRSEQFDAAALLAQMGDYSAYGKLYGWDDATIQKMNSLWQQANMNRSSSASSYSGSSGGSSSGGSSSGSGYDALFQAAMESGYPESFIANNAKDYGFKSSTGLYDEYMDIWLPENEVNMSQSVSSGSSQTGSSSVPVESLVSQIRDLIGRNMVDKALSVISSNWSRLTSSERDRIQRVLNEYGYSYEE